MRERRQQGGGAAEQHGKQVERNGAQHHFLDQTKRRPSSTVCHEAGRWRWPA
jgi:hypothetical protein